MDSIQSKALIWLLNLVVAVVLVLAGIGVGWYMHAPAPAKVETAAASAVQPDGSLIVERKPDATAKPKMMVPKGATVERVMQFTVQASAVAANVPDASGAAEKECPPVTLDLALVRMQDRSRQIIARALDGTILAALDTPVESAYIADPLRWAAGIGYDTDRRPKALVDYDFDRVRVGGGLSIKDGRPLPEARVMWRF